MTELVNVHHMNPIEFLSSACGEFRELSDTLREAARGVVTDVSETMDIASAILTTIVSSSAGSDPNENISRDIAEFEAMANEKERDFKSRMERQREDLSLRINDLSQRLIAMNDSLIQNRDWYKKFLTTKSAEFDARNEQALAEERARNKDAEKVIETEKKTCFDNFEKYLATRLSDVSQECAKQMKQADDDVIAANLALQETIHRKHEQKRLLQQDLETETKRMAAEHERLSREFQTHREECENNLVKIGEAIDKQNAALKRGALDAQAKLEELEKAMREDNGVVSGKLRKQIADLDEEASASTNTIEDLKLAMEKYKIQDEEFFKEQVRKKETLIQKELDTTKQALEEDRKETEEQFQMKYLEVEKGMKKVEEERKKHQEEMGKRLEQDQDKLEQGEREKKKEHAANVDEKQRDLRRAKRQLKEIRQEKDIALEKLRTGKQKEMGSALTETGESEKTRADQINALMKQFDEQQRKLTFLHQLTTEKLNKQKADEILRLKEEHELRKKLIIEQTEEEIRREAEKRFLVAEGIEDEDHQGHVRSIQERIQAVTGRIDLLNSKLDGLARMSQEKLDELMKDSDEALARDLRALAESDTRNSRGNEMVNRLLSATDDVQRRRSLVDREADAITRNLDAMRAEFESKMSKIEQEYSRSKDRLLGAQRDSEARRSSLNQQISEQKSKIDDLTQQISQRETEADDLDRNFENKKQEFAEQTKTGYESDLESAKQKPQGVQEQMSDMRINMANEMDHLKGQLDAAKAATGKITEYRMKERDDWIEETKTKYGLLSEERCKVIQDGHDERMVKLREKREASRKKRQAQIEALEASLNNTFNDNELEFESQYKEYAEAKEELQQRNAALINELYDLEHRECPECVRKKDTIRRLLAKREQLKDRLSTLLSEVQVNEEQMYHIFGTPKPHLASPAVEIQKPASAALSRKVSRPPSRAHTALGMPATPKVVAPRHAH